MLCKADSFEFLWSSMEARREAGVMVLSKHKISQGGGFMLRPRSFSMAVLCRPSIFDAYEKHPATPRRCSFNLQPWRLFIDGVAMALFSFFLPSSFVGGFHLNCSATW